MRTDIEKAALKKQMLTACIAKQQLLIDDFKKRIGALLVTDGLGNEESYDNNELSNLSAQIEEATAINEALHFAEDEMKQLMFLQFSGDKLNTKAEQGAVVVTNAATFFISVSIEQFRVDRDTYVGLSVFSPLFLVMKGLTAGEKFIYSGKEYRINDIF
jgi:hypothetical protein